MPLLSQTLVVEKNRRYNLSFSHRTENMITGGAPLLQIFLKQPDQDVLVKEIKLTENLKGWKNSSLPIQTDSRTDTLEIRLSRQSCGIDLCPIFGKLWLDNFTLK